MKKTILYIACALSLCCHALTSQYFYSGSEWSDTNGELKRQGASGMSAVYHLLNDKLFFATGDTNSIPNIYTGVYTNKYDYTVSGTNSYLFGVDTLSSGISAFERAANPGDGTYVCGFEFLGFTDSNNWYPYNSGNYHRYTEINDSCACNGGTLFPSIVKKTRSPINEAVEYWYKKMISGTEGDYLDIVDYRRDEDIDVQSYFNTTDREQMSQNKGCEYRCLYKHDYLKNMARFLQDKNKYAIYRVDGHTGCEVVQRTYTKTSEIGICAITNQNKVFVYFSTPLGGTTKEEVVTNTYGFTDMIYADNSVSIDFQTCLFNYLSGAVEMGTPEENPGIWEKKEIDGVNYYVAKCDWKLTATTPTNQLAYLEYVSKNCNSAHSLTNRDCRPLAQMSYASQYGACVMFRTYDVGDGTFSDFASGGYWKYDKNVNALSDVELFGYQNVIPTEYFERHDKNPHWIAEFPQGKQEFEAPIEYEGWEIYTYDSDITQCQKVGFTTNLEEFVIMDALPVGRFTLAISPEFYADNIEPRQKKMGVNKYVFLSIEAATDALH